MKKEIIKTEMKVKDNLVRVMRVGNIDYIFLTDLAKYQNEDDPSGVIINWMSNKNSFELCELKLQCICMYKTVIIQICWNFVKFVFKKLIIFSIQLYSTTCKLSKFKLICTKM